MQAAITGGRLLQCNIYNNIYMRWQSSLRGVPDEIDHRWPDGLIDSDKAQHHLYYLFDLMLRLKGFSAICGWFLSEKNCMGPPFNGFLTSQRMAHVNLYERILLIIAHHGLTPAADSLCLWTVIGVVASRQNFGRFGPVKKAYSVPASDERLTCCLRTENQLWYKR